MTVVDHVHMLNGEPCLAFECPVCVHLRRQTNRLEAVRQMLERALFFVAHPELVPYVPTEIGQPGWVPIEEPDLDEWPDLEERITERGVRELAARIEMLRAAGFELSTVPAGTGAVYVRATHPDLSSPVMCWCASQDPEVVEAMVDG